MAISISGINLFSRLTGNNLEATNILQVVKISVKRRPYKIKLFNAED